MAGSLNKVQLIGNLGANPELQYLPSGQAVCEIRLATSHTYKDRNDQPQEQTEWHRVKTWGKTAENCSKFLEKGSKIYVEGKLQTRTWDDKDGKKCYMTEVIGFQIIFLSRKAGTGDPPASHTPAPARGSGGSAPAPSGGGSGYEGTDFGGEDDIPF